MKRIYEVQYEEKWTGCSDWLSDHVSVLANGDMQAAIQKAKTNALSKSYKDENGKMQRCIKFRATAVKVLAEAEI